LWSIAEEILALYREYVYPNLVTVLGNPKPIHELRRRILALAEGAVLEVGFGSGVNLAYYDPITRLHALEPNPGMIQIAERHPKRKAFDVHFLALPGGGISLAHDSVDTVVTTFTLCTLAASMMRYEVSPAP